MGQSGQSGLRAALCCRVSTVDQSCARQERDLFVFAERASDEVVRTYKGTASGVTLDRAERRLSSRADDEARKLGSIFSSVAHSSQVLTGLVKKGRFGWPVYHAAVAAGLEGNNCSLCGSSGWRLSTRVIGAAPMTKAEVRSGHWVGVRTFGRRVRRHGTASAATAWRRECRLSTSSTAAGTTIQGSTAKIADGASVGRACSEPQSDLPTNTSGRPITGRPSFARSP